MICVVKRAVAGVRFVDVQLVLWCGRCDVQQCLLAVFLIAAMCTPGWTVFSDDW
jgi:hypothetical protein